MKKISLLFLLITSNLIYGQQLGAYFGFSVFHVPEETSFLETYISVIGETVSYQKINDKIQGLFTFNDIRHAFLYLHGTLSIFISDIIVPDFIPLNDLRIKVSLYL